MGFPTGSDGILGRDSSPWVSLYYDIESTVGYHLPQIVVPQINPQIISPFGDNKTIKVNSGHQMGILIWGFFHLGMFLS